MKKLMIAAICTLMFMHVFSQGSGSAVSLIPIPVSMQMGQGNFLLKNNTSIELATTDADAKRVAGFLSEKLSVATGFKIPLKLVQKASNAAGNISLAIVQNATLGNEGYKLNHCCPTKNSIKSSATFIG